MTSGDDVGCRDEWPANALEPVPDCPMCGGQTRDQLHSRMRDRVFGIAPGAWDMYRCVACRSAWLDPRPDQESLPRAYAGYFTHDKDAVPVVVRRRGYIRRWLHDLLNDYIEARYNAGQRPRAFGGRWLAWLLPPLRAAADASCRHLLVSPSAGRGRLLDVGCGNGAFLRLARDMGWEVAGLDFDPEAVARAREDGFQVTVGGVEALADEADAYDVVTLSHVFEHVPHPRQLLDDLYRLLKPGGSIWLETPNISSLGHWLFGPDWRDLDPPRHLVLVDASTLREALADAGFAEVRQHWHALVGFETLRASSNIRSNGAAHGGVRRGRRLLLGAMVEIAGMLVPRSREFLTFTARKPVK